MDRTGELQIPSLEIHHRRDPDHARRASVGYFDPQDLILGNRDGDCFDVTRQIFVDDRRRHDVIACPRMSRHLDISTTKVDRGAKVNRNL